MNLEIEINVVRSGIFFFKLAHWHFLLLSRSNREKYGKFQNDLLEYFAIFNCVIKLKILILKLKMYLNIFQLRKLIKFITDFSIKRNQIIFQELLTKYQGLSSTNR
jgi:hypothetical protein